MSPSSLVLPQQAALLRQAIRRQEHTGPTSGYVAGAVQGNVIILPSEYAQDFLQFCQSNPITCPLISVSEAGNFRLASLGRDIDIRHDVPEYCVFKNGEKTEQRYDIEDLWHKDLVTFVLGCSFSFEHALSKAGLCPRNIEEGVNVSMYETNLSTTAAGPFQGNIVVSMRPYTPRDAIQAIQITSCFAKAHGAPIHFGEPSAIGIHDLTRPDFGDAVTIKADEVPVFWACGVTPQVAIRMAKPPLCITHVPGKMLVTDILDTELATL